MEKVITTEKVPIKLWLDNIEPGALQQTINLANLPFVYKHIAIMPDAHQGYGMPIGGVMATDGVVVPNAVGVDIGCGMRFCQTDIKWEDVKTCTTGDGQEIRKAMLANVMRNVPVGFNKHKTPQDWERFDSPPDQQMIHDELDNAALSLGTLGGGR